MQFPSLPPRWNNVASSRAVVAILGVVASNVILAFPIVDKGADNLIGRYIPTIAAHALVEGQWRRIALQIDEKNKHGDFVLNEGLPFTKQTDDRYFDANDELVFESESLGKDFSWKDIPASIRTQAVSMWKLAVRSGDALLGYVLVVEHRSPQSGLDKPAPVTFDAVNNIVETQRYRYAFKDNQAALLGQVALKTKAGAVNLFKRSQFVMALKLPWFLPDFNLTDRNFISQVESWRQGPVRTIVAVGVKFKNFLSLFNMHMFSELVFYRAALQIPTVIEFTFDPSRYLRVGSGLAYSITYADNVPVEISSNLGDLPDAPAAYAAANSPNAAQDAPFRAHGRSPVGQVSLEVRVDPEAAKMVPPPFLIAAERLGRPEPGWDWMSAMSGDLGVFLDISGVREGLYDFGLDLVLHSEAHESSDFVFSPTRVDWALLAPK